MRIVLLIALLEIVALSLWLLRRWLSRIGAGPTPMLAAAGNPITARLPTPGKHSVFITDRLIEGQSDDRKQTRGSVATVLEPASAHRARARRSHQTNYKQWSKERHE